MKVTIDNKDYELNFGMGFVRALNKAQGMIVEQVNIGNAIEKTLPGLLARDPEMLEAYVLCANRDLTQRNVDKFIENLVLSDEDGQAFEEFADKLLDAVKEGTMTRLPFKKATQRVEEYQAKKAEDQEPFKNN